MKKRLTLLSVAYLIAHIITALGLAAGGHLTGKSTIFASTVGPIFEVHVAGIVTVVPLVYFVIYMAVLIATAKK